MSTTHQSTNEPQPLRIDDFDWSHVDIARRAMMSLLEQIKTYEGQYDALPLPDSQASREMMLIPQVEKAYHRVGTLMMNAFDHAYALNALLAIRSRAFAPWTCGRVILEACALASWLLDSEIVCRERVLRCIKLRLRDIRDQRLHYKRNLSQISKSSLKSEFEDEQLDLNNELKHLWATARELNLPINEKKLDPGKFEDLGGAIKTIELVVQYLEDTSEWFQTTSGIVHSNEWTMYNLGMRPVRPGTLEVESNLTPFKAMHLIFKSTEWIGNTLTRNYRLLGTSIDEFQGIVDANRPIAWVHQDMTVSDN